MRHARGSLVAVVGALSVGCAASTASPGTPAVPRGGGSESREPEPAVPEPRAKQATKPERIDPYADSLTADSLMADSLVADSLVADSLMNGAIPRGLRARRLPDALGALGAAGHEDAISRGPLWTWRVQLDERDLESEMRLWEPCVRAFVRARPEPVRRALARAFASHETGCGAGGAVIVRAALGLDGRGRAGRSEVALTGAIGAARNELALRVASCGASRAGDAAPAERIVIVADGARWTSHRLGFARDARGCDAAELPLTRALARVVRDLADSTDGSIAFEGGAAPDLAVTDEMKQDLRTLLDAVDALDDAADDARPR